MKIFLLTISDLQVKNVTSKRELEFILCKIKDNKDVKLWQYCTHYGPIHNQKHMHAIVSVSDRFKYRGLTKFNCNNKLFRCNWLRKSTISALFNAQKYLIRGKSRRYKHYIVKKSMLVKLQEYL